MLTILEIHDSWGDGWDSWPQEGSYFAEKLGYFSGAGSLTEALGYVLVRPAVGRWTEASSRTAVVEHLDCRTLPDGRPAFDPRRLRELIQLHRPRLILCPSPLLMPASLWLSGLRLDPRPALVGLWPNQEERMPEHQVAQVGAALLRTLPRLAPALRERLPQVSRRLPALGEDALWRWIQLSYGSLDAVFVTDADQAEALRRRGIERLFVLPRAPGPTWSDCFDAEVAVYQRIVARMRRPAIARPWSP